MLLMKNAVECKGFSWRFCVGYSCGLTIQVENGRWMLCLRGKHDCLPEVAISADYGVFHLLLRLSLAVSRCSRDSTGTVCTVLVGMLQLFEAKFGRKRWNVLRLTCSIAVCQCELLFRMLFNV